MKSIISMHFNRFFKKVCRKMGKKFSLLFLPVFPVIILHYCGTNFMTHESILIHYKLYSQVYIRIWVLPNMYLLYSIIQNCLSALEMPCFPVGAIARPYGKPLLSHPAQYCSILYFPSSKC